ncbi:MAG: hypothetical protein V1859_10660 [archaeon]
MTAIYQAFQSAYNAAQSSVPRVINDATLWAYVVADNAASRTLESALAHVPQGLADQMGHMENVLYHYTAGPDGQTCNPPWWPLQDIGNAFINPAQYGCSLEQVGNTIALRGLITLGVVGGIGGGIALAATLINPRRRY